MEAMYITFEDYLRQQLDPKAKKGFEDSLLKDSNTNESFHLYKMLRKHIQLQLVIDEDKKQLKSTLSALGNKHFSDDAADDNPTSISESNLSIQTAKPRSLNRVLMSIAAGFLFITAFGFGLKQYANVNYGNAAIAGMFDQSSSRSATTVSSADYASIQTANVAIQNNRYEAALTSLMSIAETSEYFDQAQWQAAQVHIITGETVKAKAILYELSTRDNEFQMSAKNVIQKMESIMYRIATF